MQEVANLVGTVLKIGLVLMAVGIGLQSRWSDVTYLFRRTRLLLKSVLARNVIVPCAALVIVMLLPLEPVVRNIVLALSVTAVPPFLPAKQHKAGGRLEYDIGLFASQIMFAIVLIPVSLLVVNQVLGIHAHFPPRQVASNVGQLIILPFALGMLVGRLAPARRERLSRAAGRLAMGLLVGVGLVILVGSWKVMVSLLGNGTLIAMALLVMVGLAAGHLLGGPRNDDRTSLALASASSHPGLAIAIVATNAPEQARLATAAVLLYLLIGLVLARPYIVHQRGQQPAFKLSRSGVERRRQHRVGADRRTAVG
jgi:predicted Na+-dependent transporter